MSRGGTDLVRVRAVFNVQITWDESEAPIRDSLLAQLSPAQKGLVVTAAVATALFTEDLVQTVRTSCSDVLGG